LAIDRQINEQTDEQMDTPVAWSRSLCRERRLNKRCGRRVRSTRYAPPVCNPDLWSFDHETGVWVAFKAGTFISNLGTLGLRVLELFAYVRDRQTDKQKQSSAYCSLRYGRGHNNADMLNGAPNRRGSPSVKTSTNHANKTKHCNIIW